MERTQDRGIWGIVGTVAAVAALIVASLAIAQANDQDGPGDSLAGTVKRPGSGAAASAGGPSTVEVSLSEFALELNPAQVPSGAVTLAVTNDGAIAHNVVMQGTGSATPDLNSGETAELDLGTLDPGEYLLFCDIPGHADAGMRATLTVSSDAAPASGSGDHGGDGTDYAALDAAMMESMLAFPATTEGVGGQVLEPRVLADGTKEFRLTAAITKWEVEPGNFVDAWTYNGQVPGPLIRADVGDRLRVVVTNNLPMGTDVHWHGVDTPNSMDGVAPYTQDLIEPGETFTYEYTAQATAVGMYHAHNHAQMQVPNGLLGPIMIGNVPLPTGRTVGGVALPDTIDVAQEFPMVLNDAGAIGYSLNGKSFPATAPVAASQGDWLLVHYMNEGLQIHPMHLHQFNQLIVAKDGIPLDQPYWADTINVAPGERYSVLINTTDPGTWVWHCHILTHVEREDGMFGMVTAVVVE